MIQKRLYFALFRHFSCIIQNFSVTLQPKVAKVTKTGEKIMARPIKETPILFGDEARRFEMQMLNPRPISTEQKARMLSDYEFLRARCVNCAF